MSNRLAPPIHTGSHGAYQWLVSEHELSDLLALCPEIVLGKHIAVTSCDSGPLVLNAQQLAIGWESRKGIAYSPRVLAVDALPREQFDEWYVFNDPFDLGALAPQRTNVFEARLSPDEVHPFVNFFAFALQSLESHGLVKLFWEQFDWIRPDTYIADGTCLTVVSADKSHFDPLLHRLRTMADI